MTGQIDDPEIDARRAARAEQTRAHLSVADRLTTRAKNRRETITIGEGPDAVEIEFRVPLACEVKEIEDLQTRTLGAVTEMQRCMRRLATIEKQQGSNTKRQDLADRMTELEAQANRDRRRHLEILADLIIDESVTVEYLESGEMALEDVGTITMGIMERVRELAEQARFLRRQRPGEGAAAVVHENGKTPP